MTSKKVSPDPIPQPCKCIKCGEPVNGGTFMQGYTEDGDIVCMSKITDAIVEDAVAPDGRESVCFRCNVCLALMEADHAAMAAKIEHLKKMPGAFELFQREQRKEGLHAMLAELETDEPRLSAAEAAEADGKSARNGSMSDD